MISIILSLGAINAFIPLIIILILIFAAAGLVRGYNIFALFGISALLGGAGKATLAGKNVAARTGGVRKYSITRKKAQALWAYAQKRAISKGKAFAKYYKQEYNAARANGVSRFEAAKIASSNARIRMMLDSINKFQDSFLSKLRKTHLYKNGSKTNKRVTDVMRKSLDTLKNSPALKDDKVAQNLYNSIDSRLNKLDNLYDQVKQIKLDRTSAAAAKANLNKMRQIQKGLRENMNNLVKDVHRFEQRYHTNSTIENAPHYVSESVNLVILGKEREKKVEEKKEEQRQENLKEEKEEKEKEEEQKQQQQKIQEELKQQQQKIQEEQKQQQQKIQEELKQQQQKIQEEQKQQQQKIQEELKQQPIQGNETKEQQKSEEEQKQQQKKEEEQK
jgi:hypothetical protein